MQEIQLDFVHNEIIRHYNEVDASGAPDSLQNAQKKFSLFVIICFYMMSFIYIFCIAVSLPSVQRSSGANGLEQRCTR